MSGENNNSGGWRRKKRGTFSPIHHTPPVVGGHHAYLPWQPARIQTPLWKPEPPLGLLPGPVGGSQRDNEWDRGIKWKNETKMSNTHMHLIHGMETQEGQGVMTVLKTGTDHIHVKEFLHRHLKRRKRNLWAPWQVVYVTGRIRGLLARTKLVRGRKRREWHTHSGNLQGWRECQRGMTTSPPFTFSLPVFLLTWYLYNCMHTSTVWLKVAARLFSGFFVAYSICIKRFP